MLSARTTYREIFDDEAFCLFCSIAASREAQSRWGNGKIAALVPGSQAGLILGWPRLKAAVLAAVIRAVYARERLGGWRRTTWLPMPARRDALAGRVPAQPRRA